MAWKKLFNLDNNVVVNYDAEEPIEESTPPNRKELEVISSSSEADAASRSTIKSVVAQHDTFAK